MSLQLPAARDLDGRTNMEVTPVRWGVLGVASIAIGRALPPLVGSLHATIAAIASRSEAKAQAAAKALGVSRAYGSYEELLADPTIEAVYIPLPITLHAEWTMRALEAGKHVLCEKPLAPSAAEVERMQRAADKAGRLLAEAFMLFSHPRIRALRALAREGVIGKLGSVQFSFSNPNLDPENIRNRPETGGGALLDKGCYTLALARYLFDAEPDAVAAASDIDPVFGVDTLTAGIMRFGRGIASIDTCSSLVVHQRLVALGTEGSLCLDMPATPDPAQPTVLEIVDRSGMRTQQWAPCNQYRLMFDEVSLAIRGVGEAPVRPAFSLGNARTIEAFVTAAAERRWVTLPA
jgi:predicted dehydrogenase